MADKTMNHMGFMALYPTWCRGQKTEMSFK